MMTDGPFVYGIELRDPPTASTDLTQYDLLFGPGSLLYRPPVGPMAVDYGEQLYGTNLSLGALGELLRDNITATIGGGPHNLSGEAGRNTAGSLAPVAAGGGTAGAAAGSGRGGDSTFQNQLIIPLYAIIFLLSVVGNLLVILTLAQNKRMRTVTNVYLLNLAISDLLLGVFCMPFTLAGQVLRRFVFGSVMCKLIPYFQAVSVSVAVWTLVAISLERYFAICRPLSSRRWQTQFHAYKMIALVWTVSFLANSPLGYVQRLLPVGRNTGQMKCREEWPNPVWEKAYVLFHDVGLLFLPLLTMGFAYSMIVSKLWRGLRHEIKHSSLYQQTSRQQHGTGGQGSAVGGGCGTAVAVSCAGTGVAVADPVPAEKPMKTVTNSKRHDGGGFVLTSSLKKGPFKTSTAVVNFASNNNTIGKGSFNGGGACSTTNGAGSSSSSGGVGSNGAGTDQRTHYCGGVGCETRPGRLRGFRHFFAKQQHQHGGVCRNQRYQLSSSAAPDGLPELAETKFDETVATQQPPYHHCHCHHGYHHHHHRMPPTSSTIVKSTQQDAKHEIVLGEPGMEQGVGDDEPGGAATGGGGGGGGVTGTMGGQGDGDPATLKQDPAYQFSRHAIRSTYMDKSIEAKKKVIRMLFVIIVEFFVCWAPLHILNTVYLYSPTFVYQYVNSSGIALVQLMAYISSCCNPITYCFMNRRFRQAFLGIFSCYRNRIPSCCCCFCCASPNGTMDGAESKAAAYLRQNTINQSGAERNNSDMSGNDSLVYVGRGLVQRSEILILESEDRV